MPRPLAVSRLHPTTSDKAHTPEEIVAKLRQAEVLVAQGKSVAEAVQTIGVATRFSWRVAMWRNCLSRLIRRSMRMERQKAAGDGRGAVRGHEAITAVLGDVRRAASARAGCTGLLRATGAPGLLFGVVVDMMVSQHMLENRAGQRRGGP
ncbi:hypothetical protein [Siccirubricoccus sp. G192]|uniref:hypothetical protein n=1 Tax=Siccirubricoccus sp. G192 TaxID=2849651 RepID=UPI001C2BA1AE|nr:hypothetical protein [Siccirubricoccus sp. G192]MBV1795646.1 hypothetical protein [Siccirubricoccus sp. G192]